MSRDSCHRLQRMQNQVGSLRALVAAWQVVCLSSVAGRRPLSQMLGQCELSGVIAHGAP